MGTQHTIWILSSALGPHLPIVYNYTWFQASSPLNNIFLISARLEYGISQSLWNLKIFLSFLLAKKFLLVHWRLCFTTTPRSLLVKPAFHPVLKCHCASKNYFSFLTGSTFYPFYMNDPQEVSSRWGWEKVALAGVDIFAVWNQWVSELTHPKLHRLFTCTQHSWKIQKESLHKGSEFS